ncbi:MAG: HesA/MoeB/ThiF family protein [Thermoplasmatota archaeon]
MNKKKLVDLTEKDRERYDRQIMIDGFEEVGQRRLKSTTAFIAGAGGLGSPASIYLAVAGMGKLKIVDNDKVDLNNLNRQILYSHKDIGNPKAKAAEKNLERYNKDIEIEGMNVTISENNIDDLVKDCDLIVDCMDNYETRYLLNQASLDHNIPFFHAAVHGMRGQASTFIPGETACLKCIVPSSPSSETFPVLGATPGLLATVQVHEVVKYVVGLDNLLSNQLLIVEDGSHFDTIEIEKNPDCDACGHL